MSKYSYKGIQDVVDISSILRQYAHAQAAAVCIPKHHLDQRPRSTVSPPGALAQAAARYSLHVTAP